MPSMQMIALASEEELTGCDGIIAQSQGPLGTEGCEAHMGQQSAYMSLSTRPQREMSAPVDLEWLRLFRLAQHRVLDSRCIEIK